MRLVLKIILLVIILAIALFFAGIMFYIIVIQKVKFDSSMLIVIGISILGFLSSWFHIKTIKLYKLDLEGKVLEEPSKVFWVLNIGFSGALILLSGWIFYMAFLRFGSAMSFNSSEDRVFMIFLVMPILVGGFILFESYFLKTLLKKNKDRQLILEIDNIKGEQENN